MPLLCCLVFKFHKVYFSTWWYCVNISSNMYLNSFWCRFIKRLHNHAITSCFHGTVSKHIRNNQWEYHYFCLQRYQTSFLMSLLFHRLTYRHFVCTLPLCSGEISSWTSRLCDLIHYWHLSRVSLCLSWLNYTQHLPQRRLNQATCTRFTLLLLYIEQ